MFSIGFINDPLIEVDWSEERVGSYANLSRSSWSLIFAGRRELASTSCSSLVGISRLKSRARASERCAVRRKAARTSLAGGPLRMPRDRMHQSCAGRGTKHGADDEGFGQSRVFERDLHDSGLAGYGFGVVYFGGNDFAFFDCAVFNLAGADLAFPGFYIQQERRGYSARGAAGQR